MKAKTFSEHYHKMTEEIYTLKTQNAALRNNCVRLAISRREALSSLTHARAEARGAEARCKALGWK